MLVSKICRDCKEELPISLFSPTSAYADGYDSRCHGCRSINDRERYADGKIDKRLDYKRSWHLKTKYNLTLEEYDSMHNKQNGLCAICNNPEVFEHKSVITKLAVDHNHNTGEVRGLLCRSCNRLLGQFEDNPQILQNMIDYLLQYSKEEII